MKLNIRAYEQNMRLEEWEFCLNFVFQNLKTSAQRAQS